MYAALLDHAAAVASGERSLERAIADAEDVVRRYTRDSSALAGR
jgi:hypothetical protein